MPRCPFPFCLGFNVATLSSVLFALATLQCLAAPAEAATSRIRGPIVDSDVVSLKGNVHPLARGEFDAGVVPSETRLERMVLLMQPSHAQQLRLDRLTASQQDQKSSQYRAWLSPEQYAESFGVSDLDLKRTVGWLKGHGFEVEPSPAGHQLLIFSGTAGQVAETFHTEIHHYLVQGKLHVANSEDPQIPRALSPVVAGVLSLHDFRRASQAQLVHRLTDAAPQQKPAAVGYAKIEDFKDPDNTEGNAHYLFPADFAMIYDVNPLYASGTSGNGVGIAIVGRSNIKLTDVSGFRSYAGLAAKAPSILLDGPNPGLVSGDQDEATLDVEWSGGVAPSANVTLVAAQSTATTDGVDLAAQYIVNHRTASVMSTSFGSCETSMGATEIAFYNSLWQQASAEGISAFVSSGDSGASGCDSGSAAVGSGAAVNGLCSSPYATCVGGTEFNDVKNGSTYWSPSNGSSNGSALSYIPETVWNESGINHGSGLWASGGGISQIYPQPSWQKSITGANSNGMRAVPDVALNAAAHDGYLVELDGNWYDFAGTSAASPTMAAIMALVVQHQAGIGQGNVNASLYGMLNASSDPFHATPSGNNSVQGVGGFVASGAAYNLASGLGSVDANVLVDQWPAAENSPQPGFTLSPSTSSVLVVSGNKSRLTLQVTASGGYSGAVSLAASKLPLGVTVQFNPAVIKPGSTSMVTVTATNSAVAGTTSILLTGTSGSLEASTALAVLIDAAPSITIGVQAIQLAIKQGNSLSVMLMVNTGGAFSGLVKLGVTGLPSGVSSSWSESSFEASGVTTATSTLTLTASVNAQVSTSAIKIVARGDGLSVQAIEQLQITAAPGLTMALAPAAISMKSNGIGQIVVRVNPVGGLQLATSLAGVKFLTSPLPAGVTESWSQPILTTSGAIQTVLTLSGSKTAAAGSSSFNIKCALTVPTSAAAYSVSMNAGLTLSK